MTGSVIDGEDVVQEALLKAIEALPETGSIAHPEAWLFRIAYNAALDYLHATGCPTCRTLPSASTGPYNLRCDYGHREGRRGHCRRIQRVTGFGR
jgi:hypothetical protein